MRYAEIIGQCFYGIKLSPSQYARVDAHFLASAHHHWRADQTNDPEIKGFHHGLMMKHLSALRSIVASGDFHEATDLTKNSLDQPAGWRALIGREPNPDMFEGMCPDRRWHVGLNHGYDPLLGNPSLSPSQIRLDDAAA